MGIKDIGTQNICLLLKLIHKLHCPQSSAWAQWVKASCTNKEASVREMLQSSIQQSFVPRLSPSAMQQLVALEEITAGVQLSDEPDRRTSAFIQRESGLDSGAIYKLLKARGQPNDERSSFIWHNSAPPRVKLFMWLLEHQRIQCHTVLQRKHVLLDNICEVCNLEEETLEHIVSGCARKLFWEKMNMTLCW